MKVEAVVVEVTASKEVVAVGGVVAVLAVAVAAVLVRVVVTVTKEHFRVHEIILTPEATSETKKTDH